MRSKRDAEAYGAVLELGRMGGERAVDLLIETLSRGDGLARAAARELGQLDDARAVEPLAGLLSQGDVRQAASEALTKLGSKSVEALLAVLQADTLPARKAAVVALGDIADRRAVEPLIQVLQADDDYAMRTAAATALGQLKDPRAVWVLVGTLKLRDETGSERQEALRQLRHAANVAMRKIGDPLAAKSAADGTEQPADTSSETAELHPRLRGDLKTVSEAEIISVLKELIGASEEISWAKLENREPILPPHFQSYDLRRRTAELLGAELHRRGGAELVKRVLARDLGQYAAIHNWWAGIGG